MSRLISYGNDGLTFDVIDEGPVDGDPIVLLHGWPQTGTSWNRLIPHLHALGYRTIAPTQRGYSVGARPRGRFAYRMSALVGDTVALIDAVGAGPVHLVGHDWGSTVAWSTAARHPELVRTLTSVSVPHAMAFIRSMLSSSQAIRAWYMAAFQLPWVPEKAFELSKHLPQSFARGGMDDEQITRLFDEVIDSGAMTYGLNWYRAMLLADPREVKQKVAVPTTHVWSTRDGVLTRKSADLAAEYVTGPYRLEVLDATHWIPEERPAELAAIVAARIADSG